MAKITISDLHPAELKYEKMSDLELKSVVGGKAPKYSVNLKWSQKEGVSVGLTIKF
ncbi:hypothetical protein [Coleofasciculus chthonoplastes]|uniref:hypothetical protein n=1 Tax=Coleofasciculus chthonoplastes TaxID=64178 RepID=UPI0040649271